MTATLFVVHPALQSLNLDIFWQDKRLILRGLGSLRYIASTPQRGEAPGLAEDVKECRSGERRLTIDLPDTAFSASRLSILNRPDLDSRLMTIVNFLHQVSFWTITMFCDVAGVVGQNRLRIPKSFGPALMIVWQSDPPGTRLLLALRFPGTAHEPQSWLTGDCTFFTLFTTNLTYQQWYLGSSC